MRFILTANIAAVLDLTIHVSVEGGESFLAETPVNRIGMAAGDDTAWLILRTVDDKVHEADDDIVATVEDGSRYDPGSPGSATVTVKDNDPLPPKVTGVTATLIGTDSIRVAWNGISGVSTYKVERRQDGGAWRIAAYVPASRALDFSWPIPPLPPTCLTTHGFRVSAYGDGETYAAEYGPPSTDSASVTVRCPPPPAPTGLAVTSFDEESVSLSWDAVDGTYRYRVEYRADGDSEWSTDSSFLYSTSRTVENLECETDYDFRVSVLGDGTTYAYEWSDPSTPVPRTTRDCPPGPPTNLSISVAGTRLDGDRVGGTRESYTLERFSPTTTSSSVHRAN